MKFIIELSEKTIKKLEDQADRNGRSRKAEAEQILISIVNPEEGNGK